MFNVNSVVSQQIAHAGIKVRPNADPGLWLMLLLPSAIIISCVRHPKEASQLFHFNAALCVGLLGTSVLFIVQCVTRRTLALNRTLYLMPAAATATLFRFYFNSGLVFSLLNGLFSSIFYWKVMLVMFNKFPLSFTVGELSLVAQAITLFFYSTLVNLYMAVIRTPHKVMDVSTIIIQVGLCTVGIIVLLVHRLRNLRTILSFYVVSGLIFSFFILIFLHILLRQNPLLWIFYFIFEDISRTKMVLYWVACSAAAVLALDRQIQGAAKATPVIRKIFHIFAVAVFLPGLIYQCSFIYLASGVVFGIFVTLEIMRILIIPPLGNSLQQGFVMYRDEKDTGDVALTPLYLLVGCALPLWIHPAACDILDSAGFNLLPVMSGILSIGIGDTAASIVGTKFGRHFWPGTKKTMEGTLGCILSQLIVVYILAYLGFINATQYELIRVVIAIVAGSLAEASTTQIDNIVLPLILYIILC